MFIDRYHRRRSPRCTNAPANKISDEDLEIVRQHILAIPAYESHYCRQQSSKRYLPAYYTLARMYEEYSKWGQTKRVSRKVHESIFKTMNISIKSPQKDTCQTCDKLHMIIKAAKDNDKKETAKTDLSEHKKKAQDAYDFKKQDKELAKGDITKLVYTFDLQQCLPTPAMATSVAFYKRQLWTFNLTLHRCNDNISFNMMWHEALSGRGANNIASCLYKHFTELVSPEVNHITLYSDTCPGQNKNWHISNVYLISTKIEECGVYRSQISRTTYTYGIGLGSLYYRKKKS